MVSGRNQNFGEFQELLSMLEKSSEEQRQQTLSLIQKDDPAKAALLKAQILSVNHVFMLDEESLSRVLEDVSEENIAHTLRGLDIELRKRALELITFDKRKQILNIIRKPTPDSSIIESARRQLISRVRDLEKRGTIHLGSLKKHKNLQRKVA